MLSSGFFVTGEPQQPQLQILQSRGIESSVACVRLRCYDGEYSYDQIGISKNLSDTVLASGIMKYDKNAIIKVLKYYKLDCTIIIEEYVVLSNHEEVNGIPKKMKCQCPVPHEIDVFNDAGEDCITRSEAEKIAIDINFISPYLSQRWTICGVVSEINIKEIQSKRGPLMLLTFSVSRGSLIEVKAFGNIIKKFKAQLSDGRTISITGDPGCVRKSFRRAVNDAFEIVLDYNCVIQNVES